MFSISAISIALVYAFTCIFSKSYGQDLNDDSWFQTVYTLGGTVTLNCSGQPYPNMSTAENWMFPVPDLDVVNKSFNDSRVWVAENGWNLVITNLRAEDLGQYHCMLLTPENEWYLVKLGINIEGPYFEDLALKYRSNVIQGLSVTAIFIISYFLGRLIYYRCLGGDHFPENVIEPMDDSENSIGMKEKSVSNNVSRSNVNDNNLGSKELSAKRNMSQVNVTEMD